MTATKNVRCACGREFTGRGARAHWKFCEVARIAGRAQTETLRRQLMCQPETRGLVLVGVVETTVLGINAYHASCLTCGWRCHRQPHDGQAIAARCAERHECGLR